MVFAPKEVRNLKHNVRKYDEVPSHECYVTSNNRQICINTCTLLYTNMSQSHGSTLSTYPWPCLGF